MNEHPLNTRHARLRPVLVLLGAALVLSTANAQAQTTDTSPPLITPHVSGTLGEKGWRIADTTVGWSWSDPESGVIETIGCDTRTVREETVGIDITCRVTNGAGVTVALTVPVKLDKFAPTVTRVTSRSPDANRWFNHRIDFAPEAADSTSGATCDPIPSYGGPDTRRLRIVVRCRDEAGHRVTVRRTLRYDETPPRRVRAIKARPPDRYGWYSHNLPLRWVGRDATSGLDACTSRTYRRPDTARAAVRGSCRDRAGNETFRTVRFRFSKPLLTPASGRRLESPPVLDWVRVPGASRYNAQLWHDGRKLLSRWPRRSRLDLDRVWRYGGKTRALRRGETYTWYVWPRFRSGYGPLLGRSTFTFRSKAPEPVAAVGLEPTTHGL